jgi:hypothetical protein
MNTSILFIELIIIGMQTFVWIFLLVFMQVDSSIIIKLLDNIGGEIFVIFIIPTCYTLGVFTDRIADTIFSKWNQKLKDKIIPNPNPNIGSMRYIVTEKNESLNRFLDYTRSRIRIARASSINFPISTICFIVLGVSKKYFYFFSGISIVSISIGIFFSILAIFSWKNVTIRHLDLVRTMYNNK